MNPPRDSALGRLFQFLAVPRLRAYDQKEWSDFLHPCIVLETRRALRTHVFVTGFIAMHALMLAGLILQMALTKVPGLIWFTWLANNHFWLNAGLILLIVLPVSGLFTLSTDLHMQVTETMLMTRLGPFGIVYGKWISKTMEAVLLGTTLLPYVVLRYYQYGTNPFLESAFIIAMMVGSLPLCAICISLSTIPGIYLRIGGAIGMGFWLMWVYAIAISYAYSFAVGTVPSHMDGIILIYVAAYPLGIVAALGNAAAAIGPASYNGSHYARLCALLFTGVWIFIAFAGNIRDGMGIFQFFMGLPLFASILLQDVWHPNGIRPCLRQALDRASVWRALLVPGWQAGIWWVAVTMALWSIPYLLVRVTSFSWGARLIGPIIGSLCLPFVIARVVDYVRGNWRNPAGRPATNLLYLLAVTVFLGVMGFVLSFKTIPGVVLALLPATQFVSIIYNGTFTSSGGYPRLASILAAWPMLVLLLFSVWEWLRLRVIRAEDKFNALRESVERNKDNASRE